MFLDWKTLRKTTAPIATRIQYLVGTLLLLASVLKGYELATVPTAETSLWTSRWFLIAVVEAEFALGLWLMSGLLSFFCRWTALGVFTAFFGVSVAKMLAGATNCGCFDPVSISPRYTAALDFGMILALCWWRPSQLASGIAFTPPSPPGGGRGQGEGGVSGVALPPRETTALPLFRGLAVLVLFLLVGIPGGILLGASRPGEIGDSDDIDVNQAVVLLEPEKWVGRRCPILKYTDIGDELSHGSWLVVLYHHDCPRCQELVPEYEAQARAAAADPTAPKTAFLAVPPHGAPLWPFAPASPCRHGRLSESKNWFVTTPAVLCLQDGVVQPEQDSRLFASAHTREPKENDT